MFVARFEVLKCAILKCCIIKLRLNTNSKCVKVEKMKNWQQKHHKVEKNTFIYLKSSFHCTQRPNSLSIIQVLG